MINKIEEYRKALDLSQYRLAKRVGVKRQTILLIENNKVNPSFENAIRIARELGVSLYKLFDIDGTSKYRCPCQNDDCNVDV